MPTLPSKNLLDQFLIRVSNATQLNERWGVLLVGRGREREEEGRSYGVCVLSATKECEWLGGFVRW